MITDETLAEWQAVAEKYPSGQRCNGIHSATPDARILALIAEVRELRADRDSWQKQAGDVMNDWEKAYTRAERAEAELSRRGLAFDSEYQARIKAEAEVQRLREAIEAEARRYECDPPHQGVDVNYCPGCNKAKKVRAILELEHDCDRKGQLDRSICVVCNDAYVECSVCGVYGCKCVMLQPVHTTEEE